MASPAAAAAPAPINVHVAPPSVNFARGAFSVSSPDVHVGGPTITLPPNGPKTVSVVRSADGSIAGFNTN
jgi:hypothetical protein